MANYEFRAPPLQTVEHAFQAMKLAQKDLIQMGMDTRDGDVSLNGDWVRIFVLSGRLPNDELEKLVIECVRKRLPGAKFQRPPIGL